MITNRSDQAYNPAELPRDRVHPEGAPEVAVAEVPRQGLVGSFSDLFPEDGEFPNLLKQIASILDQGIIGSPSRGVLSGDQRPINRICVNLVYTKKAFKNAVFNNANGAIPIALERPGSNGSPDPIKLEIEARANTMSEIHFDCLYGKITAQEMSRKISEVLEGISPDVFATLQERAHCSAIFVIPKNIIKFGGSKKKESKRSLQQQYQNLPSDKGIPREHYFKEVSVKPKSFSHILIPERYRESSAELESAIRSRLSSCSLQFVGDKDAKDMKLKWLNCPLSGDYPDYQSALEGLILGDEHTIIEVVLHTTRSREEPLEFRERMGWTKV